MAGTGRSGGVAARAAARAAARTDALVAALGRGLSPREAAGEVGLSHRAVLTRLGDATVVERVMALRPACGLCRGCGVCRCAQCLARGYGSIDEAGEIVVPLRDERPCHVCQGTGRSPMRTDTDLRRLRQGPAWRKVRAEVIDDWVAEDGLLCPGFGRAAHTVERGDLTTDHRVSIAHGGHVSARVNLAVLCLSCNSRKGSRRRGAAVMTAEEADAARRVGASLRAAREAAGLSLEDLRVATGRSRIYLEGVENGELALSPTDLAQSWWWHWNAAIGLRCEGVMRAHEHDLGIDYLGDRRRGLLALLAEWRAAPVRRPKRRNEAHFADLASRAEVLSSAVEAASDHAALDALKVEVDAIALEGAEIAVLDHTGRTIDDWADTICRETKFRLHRLDGWISTHYRIGPADRKRVIERVRSRQPAV